MALLKTEDVCAQDETELYLGRRFALRVKQNSNTVSSEAKQTRQERSGERHSGPWKQWHSSCQILKQPSCAGRGHTIHGTLYPSQT